MRIASFVLLAASLAWAAAAQSWGDGERRVGSVWVFGGVVDLLPGSRLDGDVWLFGGEARIDGLLIGDVIAPFGTVRFGPMAVVRGRVWAGGAVERHPDALLTRPAASGIVTARRALLAGAMGVVIAGTIIAAARAVRRARARP